MRLRQENPDMFDRFSLLMEGRTDDLLNDLVFSDLVVGVHTIIRNIEEKTQTLSELKISRQDIVRCLGVKRSNAIDLGSIGVAGGGCTLSNIFVHEQPLFLQLQVTFYDTQY